MYYTYVLIIPTTLVCLLFSTAIPTSLFIKQLFFYTCIYIIMRTPDTYVAIKPRPRLHVLIRVS